MFSASWHGEGRESTAIAPLPLQRQTCQSPVLTLRKRGRPMRWIASIAGLGCAFLAASAAAEPITRDQVVAALPKLEALAEKQIDSGGVPGLAIAVVHNDEVVYLKG